MRVVVLGCFFLSGASGLVLEMLWTRLLTLVFGSTTLAVSTVLTAFMGGLGLGSYLAGRVADKLKNPVRSYALIEAAIGVYALLVPVIVAFYPALNRWLWATFGDRYALLSVLRFAASAALLITPTTLMGATLPILSRFFVQHPWELQRVGLRIGTLYAVNLFGAVAGAFLAGFVFLPNLGVRWTNVTAASFNLTLAAAILVARRVIARREVQGPGLDELLEQAAEAGDGAARQALPPPAVVTPRARRAVVVAFGVSGATAMTLQVLWTRALAVLIGSSIFSFTIILLAFLTGLGTGSAAFGRISQRTTHPVRALAFVHLGIGATVGISYLITDRLPFVFTWLLASTNFGVDAIQFCQFALSCIAILPATFLMGGIFPLTVRVVSADLGSVGRDVGNAYAVNTIGAITGSFLSGFVVLRYLGLQTGIYLSVCLGLSLAALLFLVAPALPRPRRILGAVTAVAMALAGLALPRWDLSSFSAGFFRVSIAREYIMRKRDKKEWKVPKLVYYRDGVATTVSVDLWESKKKSTTPGAPDEIKKTFSLKNNGKVDASNDGDMATQIIVGLLPLLLYDGPPEPRVALVGYGSGVTAGGITQAPIGSLDIVELEPAIYEASHFFDPDNHRPLENPRVHAIEGDGRNFLTQRSDKFDVIVSQPSNPWLTGVSNLFTREYFQEVKRRLAPNGLFCQWAQLYEMAPWNIKTIYRTVKQEFPYVYVFSAEDLSSDTILIGSMKPLPLDLAPVERAFQNPVTRAEAKRAGLESPHDVFAYLLLDPEEIDSFTAGSPDNTDDNARIEFSAPRDLLGYARFDPYLAKVYGPLWPYGRLAPHIRGYEGAACASKCGLLARSLLAHGKAREAELWTQKAFAASSALAGPATPAPAGATAPPPGGPAGTASPAAAPSTAAAAPGAPTANGPSPEARHARLLLDLVSTRMDRDPEIPLTPEGDIEPPVVKPGLKLPAGWDANRIAEEYTEAEAHIRERRFATAYKLLEKWPEPLWTGLGQDFALVSGFLDYKAEFYQDAIDELRPLGEDERYAKRRPAALYYLGRSYYANANYVKAIAALERYIDLQSALGLPLLPESATKAGVAHSAPAGVPTAAAPPRAPAAPSGGPAASPRP